MLFFFVFLILNRLFRSFILLSIRQKQKEFLPNKKNKMWDEREMRLSDWRWSADGCGLSIIKNE